ncbi:hypothetical protein PPACK8108_LOCUS1470 [Phakopsora pachyrhizi]|uniref:1-phosphatidylinositol-3-phosphate 5-kinase n=1 Tax=Phakopsora pachyrhizi TaxID=170000 RepID=A0AAV0AFZ8_PHAPC|nr:hypothetical protein PPACK8108_LOCUS1470 [Phakopsora pachyrhizi]
MQAFLSQVESITDLNRTTTSSPTLTPCSASSSSLALNFDNQQSSYVSFPDTSSNSTPMGQMNSQSSLLNSTGDRYMANESDSPTTLLDRFKSALSASVWTSPMNTSERKASNGSLFTNSPSPCQKLTSYSNEISPHQSLVPDTAHKGHLSKGGGRVSPHSNYLTPSNLSVAQDATLRPFNLSDQTPSKPTNSASSLKILGSLQPKGSKASVGLAWNPMPLATSKSTTQCVTSNSIIANQEIGSSWDFNRSFNATSETSKAPFYLYSQPHGDATQSFTGSDALLRSLVLANAASGSSNEFPNVPTFSHIPGFPLPTETVADDAGSMLSSSFSPSITNQHTRNHWDGIGAAHHDINDSTRARNRLQGKGLSKEYWMPDKDAKECYDCAVAFTSWRRKHHCRICGAIFCARCASNLISGNRFASSGYIRVCNICLANLEPESGDPSNYKDDTEEENSAPEATASFNIFGSRSQPNHPPVTSVAVPIAKNRGITKAVVDGYLPALNRRQIVHQSSASSGDQPPNREKTSMELLSASEVTTPKPSGDHETFSSVAALSTTQPPPSNCTVSSAPFRKALSDEEQSGIPGIKDVNVNETSSTIIMSDVPQVCLDPTLTETHDTKDVLNAEEANSESDKKGNSVDDAFPSKVKKVEHVYLEKKGDNLPALPGKSHWPNRTYPSSENGQSILYEEHISAMILQFLNRANICPVSTWENELTKLLLKFASDPPRPDFTEEDAADIRKMTKIKKIPGGRPSDSEYLYGLVFTKDVVHKKMKTYYKNPRVLAISIPLEFQRVDGYSKLEPLIRQERQYLKTLVNRITSSKPDVIFVEGNVSRLAIEYLVEAKVTVMSHVKPTVLQAVARASQTPIVSSLDKLLNLQVGQCSLFQVQTLRHRLFPTNQRKSLARLEGCEPALGGTIVLRGGNDVLLSKLKSLMSMMVRIAYSLRLERAFLKEEGALLSDTSAELTSILLLQYKNLDVRAVLSRFRNARRILIPNKPVTPHKSGLSDKHFEPLSMTEAIDDILKPYEALFLSGSPGVKLNPPFVLLKLRDVNRRLNELRNFPSQMSNQLATSLNVFCGKSISSSGAVSLVENASPDPSTRPESFVEGASYKSVETKACVSAMEAEGAHARLEILVELGKQLEDERAAACYYLSTHRFESFSAVDHQRIVIQESVTYCPPSTSLGHTCQAPHLRVLSFYSAGDQSVGQIIQMIVASQSQICPAKGCGQPKSFHQTNYTHGSFKASIKIHHPEQTSVSTGSISSKSQAAVSNEPLHDSSNSFTGSDDRRYIMMQGYCPNCSGYTRKAAMTSDSWGLSFGKFLQLCFYSPGLVTEFLSDFTTGLRLPCNHDSHLEHIRMFFYQGFRIDFFVRKTIVYEAIPPPLTLVTPFQARQKAREEEYDTIRKRSEAFFYSVKTRIKGFNYDVVSVEKQNSSEEAMRELLSKAEFDAQALHSKLDEVYADCIGTNGVRMNTVRKTLIDKAVEWDQLFATFEIRFIASDSKDARRLTSVQLRKLFTDQGSIPGSPDRLFPRVHQFPASKIDSDHGHIGPVIGSFKKAFPSPNLKGVATIAALEAPSEGNIQKPEPAIVHGPNRILEHCSEPSTPSIGTQDPMDSENPMDSVNEVSTANQTSVFIPSVVVDPAPNSNPPHRSNSKVFFKGDTERTIGSSALTSEESRESVTNNMNLLIPSNNSTPKSYITNQPITSNQSQAAVNDDVDDDCKSDSTVVILRNGNDRRSNVKGSGEPRESDIDTTTGSEVDSGHEARRLTIRGRRVKEFPLKFEAPRPLNQTNTTSNASGLPEDQVKNSAQLSGPQPTVSSKQKKAATLTVRPTFRRGKRKRPMATLERSINHENDTVDSKGHSERVRHLTSKIASRNLHRLGPRIASGAKLNSDIGALVTSRVTRPRNFVVRRNRAIETGLPVSSAYVTTIARHFDRMTRDAERLKQSNEHLQAFSSLTAAVNEDSDSEIDELIPEGFELETPEPLIFEGASNPSPDVALPFNLALQHTPENSLSPSAEPSNLNYPADSSELQGSMTSHTTPCSPSFLSESFKFAPNGLSNFSDNDMSLSDTGRHSIIKTLSSLWSYRGVDFLPLDYPQLPTEHQSAENPVLIREDEPSSIIAYTLASKLYQDTLKETEPRLVERSEIFMPGDLKARSADIDSTWGMIDFASEDVEIDETLKVPTNNAKPMQFRFDVSPCTITCKVFFMHQFEVLRKNLLCKDIVESLARCHKWDASGGKSGQKFLKTKDERFLIKGISKTELEALNKFAPAYFEYLSSARKEKRPITLAKMLGIFQVSFINKTTHRKGRLQVQVIENLWATKPHLQVYDLKGLTRNRTVSVTGRPNEVLLDGNFCEMTRTDPILLHENSLLRLQASLHNDTLFLANNNVMDYSLAVGFDEQNQNLYVGIIDYLQTYSWDKRLETLVKELGGTSKEAPTIITPSLYKARFRKAMGRYFMPSPDAWLRSWKPYLLPSEDENTGTVNEKDGTKSTEGKIEDVYIHFSS